MIPHLAPWQWGLGLFCGFIVGVGKTGAPGFASLVVPLMVLLVGDARLAAAWTLPILITADFFAISYWRRHAEARTLFVLIPWVFAGMAVGAAALSLSEPVLRRMVATLVLWMLLQNLWQRWRQSAGGRSAGPVYGVAAGFATTVANAAGPVMNLYLLSKRLPKETYVATGAWFFLVVNLTKVPIYTGYHLFSRDSLLFDAWIAPAVVAGAFSGFWVVRRTPQRVFDLVILVVTAISVPLLFR